MRKVNVIVQMLQQKKEKEVGSLSRHRLCYVPSSTSESTWEAGFLSDGEQTFPSSLMVYKLRAHPRPQEGEDEIIGWEVFYGSRMVNTKHKRETDSFHRNETSFVWLAHVTKTRNAERAPHPVWVFLDLRHFHSFYRNREKVFFFLPF